MTVIRCTQKLLLEIGQTPVLAKACEQPLDEWYANLVVLDRQKCVVFLNPATFFAAIAYHKRRGELRHERMTLLNHRQIHRLIADKYFRYGSTVAVTFTCAKGIAIHLP
jgi:hypothetical protein